MNIEARLKRGSLTDVTWKAENRHLGEFRGVVFQLEGEDYVSVENPLSPENLALLRDDSQILLVLTSVRPEEP